MCNSALRRAAAAALAVAALLSGCAASQDQEALLWAGGEAQAANETTAVVERGTLTRDYSMSASVRYLRQKNVYLEAEEARYVEFLVSNGQQVRAGDTLAVFRKKGDSVRLTQIGLELEALEVERADGLSDREQADEALLEQLEEYDLLLDREKTYRVFVETETLHRKLERSAVEREQFLLRLDERKRALEQEAQRIRAEERDLIVTAPMDGVVTNVQYLSPGVTCRRGEYLMQLYDPGQYVLRSDAGIMGEFRVGQTVTVEYGRNNERSTVSGRVVAADALLTAALHGNGAAIALDEEIPAGEMLNPTVRAEELRLENVLTLPRSAIHNENNQTYVYLYTDGSPRKRYVQTGPASQDRVAILSGLDEGQTVALQ